MWKYLTRKVMFFLVREVLAFIFIRLIGNNTNHDKNITNLLLELIGFQGLKKEDWAKIAYKTGF